MSVRVSLRKVMYGHVTQIVISTHLIS